MNAHFEAIIFDFGNVLIRWDPHIIFLKYFANNVQAISSFMDEVDFYKWNHQLDEGLPYQQVLEKFSMQFPQHAHLFRAYFDEEWNKSILGIIPETVELLHKIKAAGFKLYGLTNWSAEKFPIIKQNYAFCKLFDEIIVSGEVKLAKPDPAIFHLLLRKIERSAHECLFIDDSSCNIEAARDLGFHTIHYISPDQLEEELRKLDLW